MSTCAFADGYGVVTLSIVVLSDESVGASASYTLWAAPSIAAARFDSYGTSLGGGVYFCDQRHVAGS
jgi:hypothetical protein